MRIIDMNMFLGGRDALGKPVTNDMLLETLEAYQIEHAVCYHTYALLDPQHGNGLMAEAARNSRHKLGVCAVLDPILGAACLPGEGNLTERLRSFAPEAARIFPDNARTVFHPFYWEEILSAANALSLPLIVDCEYTAEFFCQLPDISAQYPCIKFVLIRYGLCRSRHIMPLLQKRSNVYFTIEQMLDYLQIEEINEKYGCGRLLFGSGYPALPPDGALGTAIYASIPVADRQKILAHNWEAIRYVHS